MSKLTASIVAKAQPGPSGRGRLSDGRGLHLQMDGPARSWQFRYHFDGRERWMGLGSLQHVSLADARLEADTLRLKLKREGIDPLAARDARREERRLAVTFETFARGYVEAQASAWTSTYTRDWLSTLGYAFPIFGGKPVADVTESDVLAALRPIWPTPKAQRLRERLEAVLNAARVKENPARWDVIKLSLAKPVAAPKNHAALPYAQIAGLMTELRAREAMSARALEFVILTAARSGEVRLANWSEIDLAEAVWTVPAARMKMRREHRVPLSAAAVALLSALPRTGELIFPGVKGAMNENALKDMVRRMRPDGSVTVHGFRSTFSTWTAEKTNVQEDVREAALAHSKADVAGRYQRGDLLTKRRALMDAWAAACDGAPAGNVVAFPVAA